MQPMQLVAAVGGLAFVIGSLVTGARLLLVARRTRQLPELALGFGLFLMGGLGYPMTLLGEQGSFLSDGARAGFVMANTLSGVLGLSLFCFFTARVFRPESPVARASVWVVTGLFSLGFFYRLLTHGYTPTTLGGEPPLVLHSALTILTLGWAGIESLVYHSRLRKRMQLGLSDAAVVNRMWMWAQGMLCATLITAVSSIAILLGVAFNQTTLGMLVIGVFGTASAASIWFAFFPPAWYTAWIQSRWAARAEANAA